MKLHEYEKIKNLNLTYRQYCNYLKEKYGEAKYDYCTKSFNKNPKVTRTKEGLYCHHIYEDVAIMLCNDKFASANPFEYQKAENLCYCDELEHLLLHILICENPSDDKNEYEAVGIGGAINYIIPELNDFYSGWEPTLPWKLNCLNKVREDKDCYLEILKRFKTTCKNYPFYTEDCLYTSFNEQFGLWSKAQNKKIFEEIRKA